MKTRLIIQILLLSMAFPCYGQFSQTAAGYSGNQVSDIKETKSSDIQYSANGNWQIDCKKGVGNLFINGKEASLTVIYNQIYIDMTELKRYDFEKGIAYVLKEIPEDIGNIGRNLNWKEYINNEPIAYLKMIDDNTMSFYWYGFYNKKTKKREFKETNFQQESKTKEIILKKCSP
ncbi:MAG: hypothetical protein LBE92_10920 [Chryseobacterium sp.]|jgi:hypothetical protein|uniref:hypothetical protein n=1 Tax=Chryseobacterium sp. TaxID=1871047 RepID=UPI00281BE6D1|nr:hypothetical protein [Chryseobacterium sp.]MDR2236626.1 hypothetical protein [Chryseobacterium sp.]